jgi:phage terminase large subunit-like protein
MADAVIPYAPRNEHQASLHQGLESHKRGVVVAHRRFGKTVAVVNHLIKQACINNRTFPRPQYAYIAPLYRQAKKIAWPYIRYYTSHIPGTKLKEGDLTAILPNGAVIQLYGADNPDSLRGDYLDGGVIDEVAQIKPSLWDEVLRPMLSDYDGWAVFIGTPKGYNLFSRLYFDAVKKSAWFTAMLPATKTEVFSPAELEEIKSEMSEAMYRQEFLCDFGASTEDAVCPLDLVDDAMGKAIEPSLLINAPLVLAGDPAEFGDDRSALIMRKGLMAWPPETWHGLDPAQFSAVMAQRYYEFQPDLVCVDGVGVGAGVVANLQAMRIPVIRVMAGSKAAQDELYANLRAEMWFRAREWLVEGGALPQSEELRADLVAPTYEYDMRGRIALEKKKNMKARGLPSPDVGDAFAMTFAVPTPNKVAAKITQTMRPQRKYNPLEYMQ